MIANICEAAPKLNLVQFLNFALRPEKTHYLINELEQAQKNRCHHCLPWSLKMNCCRACNSSVRPSSICSTV